MPPPIYQLGQTVTTNATVPARVCNIKEKIISPWHAIELGRGYHKVTLPIGHYEIREVWRDVRYYHDLEHSDGYTYRLRALGKENPLYNRRVSVWQNDLYDAIEGCIEEDDED